MRRRLLFSAIALSACIVTSCATPPPRPVLTPEEQVRQDVTTGLTLAQEFESRVQLKKDIEVSVYLRKLAQALADPTPELSRAPLGVLLLQDAGERWRTYAL